jgi:hypothetical protein
VEDDRPLADAGEAALFDRVRRRLEDRARRHQRTPTNEGREGALLSGGILRCGTCGGPLTYGASLAKPGYRCKRLTGCGARVSIQASLIDGLALVLARRWHRRAHLAFALDRAMVDAILPGLEAAHKAAQDEVAEVEALRGKIPASSFALAHADAVKAETEARLAVETAEASQGWLGIDPQKVRARTRAAGLAERREFVKEMIRLVVKPVGRGRKVATRDRLAIQYLTAGRSAAETLGFAAEFPDGDAAQAAWLPLQRRPALAVLGDVRPRRHLAARREPQERAAGERGRQRRRLRRGDERDREPGLPGRDRPPGRVAEPARLRDHDGARLGLQRREGDAHRSFLKAGARRARHLPAAERQVRSLRDG